MGLQPQPGCFVTQAYAVVIPQNEDKTVPFGCRTKGSNASYSWNVTAQGQLVASFSC